MKNIAKILLLVSLLDNLTIGFVITTFPISKSRGTIGRRPFSCDYSRLLTSAAKHKSFVDEILDGLDKMAGVSPLSETDLKSPRPVNLAEIARVRETQAPPDDALSKRSVIVFFALLGFVPSALFLYAVYSGLKPFGL